MTDGRADLRVDMQIRRLETPVRPDEAFVSASLADLLPQVRRARSRDASWLGRLSRGLAVTPRIREWWASPRRVALGGILVLIALVLFGLLVVIIGSHRRLPPPFGLAGNGRIAYVEQGHVDTADLNGGDRRQLPLGPGFQTEPRFSPDGTRIVFKHFAQSPNQGPADVEVADADGLNLVVVTRAVTGLSHISWSPDSQDVAFSGALGPGADHGYVAHADGSGSPVDLGTFGTGAWDPTWSSDGTRLVIVSELGMFVVNRDGTHSSLIVGGETVKEFGQRGEAAEWSPDGTLIVYTAIDLNDSQQVWVVGLDGLPPRRISLDTSLGRDATWSPDGTRLAYMRRGSGLGPVLTICDPTGRVLDILPRAYAWYQPIWSPDGTKIVVTDDRPGPDNVPGPAVRVIVDLARKQPDIIIPAPGITPDDVPDWAASWQRVAKP